MKYDRLIIFILSANLVSCTVGPDYVRPPVIVTQNFKEAVNAKDWRTAQPNDDFDRGAWWQIFADPQLNALEMQLNIANQNIATAVAQYVQAQDLADEARSAYFPIISTALTVTRQKQGTTGFITPGSNALGAASTGTFNTHSLAFNASWEPDLWGSVRRTVEAADAGAQASGAQLALVRLSAQGTLAQDYFQLRTLDTDQHLLDVTVDAYQTAVNLTQNRYNAGVSSKSDVIQALSQLEAAQAQALNNRINRAKLEHAIAVLIGQPPATFNLKFQPLTGTPPQIPLSMPSTLLERRPDVAQAERLMMQANAEIGVAVAAYFPTLPLGAQLISQKRGLSHWFSLPPWSWAVTAQVAETLFDGGLRDASLRAARANFIATVATYRQTILAAYQDVEDNLVALRILHQEQTVQDEAAKNARLALKLITNQYKSGIVPYSNVITAQTTAYLSERNAADISGLRMVAAVGLIKALGGGWDASVLDVIPCVKDKEPLRIFDKRAL